MAYENLDKKALAQMARDYDNHRKEQLKLGFWGTLFALFGGCNTSSHNNESPDTFQSKESKFRSSTLDSIMTVNYDELNGSNYSPMVGKE